MANKKYYTEEARQAAMKASRKKWNAANKRRYYTTFSITITPTEQQMQLKLMRAHGYNTPGALWRVVIKMLENNLIPDNPDTAPKPTLAERNRARAAEKRAAKLEAQKQLLPIELLADATDDE